MGTSQVYSPDILTSFLTLVLFLRFLENSRLDFTDLKKKFSRKKIFPNFFMHEIGCLIFTPEKLRIHESGIAQRCNKQVTSILLLH